MKLWEKQTTALDRRIEAFTIGRDRELDMALAPYDVRASIAHAQMLGECGIIPADHAAQLVAQLQHITEQIEAGRFRIADGIEDVHSQLELELINALGTIGENIHTARSRNDQVLTALALLIRDRISQTTRQIAAFAESMLSWAQKHRRILMPGMTHMQAAMPTTFGLWMLAFAESLLEDIAFFDPVAQLTNKNPLGTAAGYGSSFPIDRRRTAALLGFSQIVASPAAAQLLRGKLERAVAFALASVSATLARLAMDVVLSLSPGYQLLRLPSQFSTGSSIMPHKQNPDVFELLRARFNRLQVLPHDISAVTTNLPSGYHRDYQLLKELLLPAWDDFDECLSIASLVLPNIEPVEGALDRPEFRAIWSVERIHAQMRTSGESFRSAYRTIAHAIESSPNETIGGNADYLYALEDEACAEIERRLQTIVNGL